MGTPLPLDRVTALVLDPGGQVLVRGALATSVDGSTFDAVYQGDGLAPGAMRTGGLFDLAAGGLRLLEQRPARHEYVLSSTGAPGPGCVAAQLQSPCLVPRLSDLAHERLRTAAELAGTLTGQLELEGVAAPPPPLVAPETAWHLALLTLAAGVGAVVLTAWVALRRRARSALGRVRSAVREALRATAGDPTLARVRTEVRAMMDRALHLEESRRACSARLRRIDRGALERRRQAVSRSTSPDAPDVLAWLAAEQAEAAKLEGDLASSVLGLERLESALRVVALRAREGRGSRAHAPRRDPADAAARELALRDEALVETEAVVSPRVVIDNPAR